MDKKIFDNFMSISTNVMVSNFNYFSTWLFYDISIEKGILKLNDIENLDIEEQDLETISLRLIHSVSMLQAFSEHFKKQFNANASQSRFNKKNNYIIQIGTGAENCNVTKIKNFEGNSTHSGDNIEYVLESLPYLIQDYLEGLSKDYDGLECIIDGIDNIIQRNEEYSEHYLDIDTQIAFFINDNLDLFKNYI